MTIHERYKFDTISARANYDYLSDWLTMRLPATTSDYQRLPWTAIEYQLWRTMTDHPELFLVSLFIGCRGPRKREFSSEMEMEKSVGNRTNFLFDGPWFFSKSQDLSFYDTLFSTVVSTSIWLTYVLQPWNFLYDHGPLQTYAGICFTRRRFRQKEGTGFFEKFTTHDFTTNYRTMAICSSRITHFLQSLSEW